MPKKLTQRLTKLSLSNVEFHWALGAMHFFTLPNIQANVTDKSSGLNNDLHESRAHCFQTKQHSSSKTDHIMNPILEHFLSKKLTQRLTKSSLSNVEFQGALDAMHFFTLQNIQANVTVISSGLNNHLHDSKAHFFHTRQNSSSKTDLIMYPIWEHF